MRGTFISKLVDLAKQDERIFLLTGDLGYMALEPFADNYPKRFINAGVAEQNMVGIATGLAEAGYIPFVYSIATFASLRPFEFIRNGPILHHLPVRIAGVGGGVEYGHNGATHWGLEDIGVMRTQPGITLIAPADHMQTSTALEKTWNLKGPVYYRLGKDDRIVVPNLSGQFELGKVNTIHEGNDILMISVGSISYQAALAVDLLAQDGINCKHVIVSSLNPAPTQDLIRCLSQFRQAITVEAHYANGGLGSLISEIVAENGLNCKITKHAVHTVPDGTTGSQKFLYEKFGLSENALVASAKNLLAGVIA